MMLKITGISQLRLGRSVEEIKYIAEGNDMEVTHMIGFNGAVVTRQDEVLFEKHIPTKDLTGIFEYLKESKLIFDALDGKQRIGNFDHEKKIDCGTWS